MSTSLADEPVEPSSDDDEPLTPAEYEPLLASLDDVWEVVDEHHLEATYSFDDFAEALAFTNKVGKLAEAEWHHPTSRGAQLASSSGVTTSTASTGRTS